MRRRSTGPRMHSSNWAIGAISDASNHLHRHMSDPSRARNPFSSLFARGDTDDRLRPQGDLSYVAGPTDDPLKFMTVPALLDRACARHGGAEAAIFADSGLRLSWYDLRARSDEVAAGLLALGIGRGDRVGVWAPNR